MLCTGLDIDTATVVSIPVPKITWPGHPDGNMVSLSASHRIDRLEVLHLVGGMKIPPGRLHHQKKLLSRGSFGWGSKMFVSPVKLIQNLGCTRTVQRRNLIGNSRQRCDDT